MSLRHIETTGRFRFRQNRDWRGRVTLVLQMQVRGLHTFWVPGASDTQWVTEWRDAKVTDLNIVGGLPSFAFTKASPA